MVFYNNNLDEYNLCEDSLKYINKGNCGSVYKIDGTDKILKTYNDETVSYYRINNEMFETIKDLNNSHIMKIYDILYKNKEADIIEAYIGEYIKSDNVDIMLKETDYLLENIKEVEDLSQKLNEHNILLDDMTYNNVILTDSKIVLIDMDSWKNIKSSKEETKRINKMEVLVLFKRIIQSTIVKQKYDNAWFYTTTQELFDFDREELMNKPLTDLVSEKIKTYKYTIDYFKKTGK